MLKILYHRNFVLKVLFSAFSGYNNKILVLVLLLISCGHRQEKSRTLHSASILQRDEVVQEIKEQSADTTFVKSVDLADSVWIGALNRIPLPLTIDQDSLINVYFRYKQPINGYEVTARWMPFDTQCETGYVVMNFHDTNTGRAFQYINAEKYNNFNTDEVTFANDFGGHCNGDVYYFEYPSPKEQQDSLHLLGYVSPFQFLDVDFDGKDELLISDWGRYSDGNHYSVYKIKDNRLVMVDYPPLNQLAAYSTKIDTVRKTITLYEQDGAYDAAELFFSKAIHPVFNVKIPQLKTWSGQSMVEAYAKLSHPQFSLDSIYAYLNDSVYEYRNISITSNSRFRGKSHEYEKISPTFDKYYDPSWDFPGDYTIGIADFPMPESSKRLILRYKTLFAKEVETWADLMDKSFRRWLSKEIKVKDYSVANYWQEMKLIRAASLRDFYISLCDGDFIPDRDCAPIDTVKINQLSSIEEYQNTTEQKRWIAWFKSRERISPFLPPKLRKVWDNCTYKACHLRLKQLTIRHMQADSTKQVQKRN